MTNTSAFLTFAFCLLPFALTVSGGQQVSPQPPPKFTAGVDVVEMDVTVLDKDHRPVRGLTAENFTVFEDGKPRKIVAFSHVELPPPVMPAATWMRDVTPDVETNDIAEHRLFVIVIDDALTGGELWRLRALRDVAKKAIDGFGPGDQAAVIFSGEGWNGQSFTADRSKLLRAVDYVRPVMAAGAGCSPLWGSTGALRAAVEALAAIPHRRKVVLYVSVGPALPIVGPVGGPCAPHAQDDAQAALRAAQLGNVNIFGIDPSGLKVNSGILDKQVNFLDDMSSNTGGRAIVNTNDMVSHVPGILEESNSYYLLGYEIGSSQADGRFHRLEVKLDKPGYEVHARKSRFDPKPPEPGGEALKHPPSPTDRAVGGDPPDSALRVDVTTAPFATAGEAGVTEVALAVRMPADSKATGRDDADLLIRAFTVDGREMASVHENIPVTLDGQRFEVASRIELKPGRYSLRIAVHSKATDKTGSVYTDVVVPDFAKEPLSLSGVVMTESSGSSLRGDALASLVPTTTRVFATDDRMQAFMRVYQGGAAAVSPVALKIRIVDTHDATVVNRTETLPATAFSRDRQADYLLRLPLSSLKPGEHWLSIEAAIGKRTVKRDVRFTVK